MGEQIKAFCWKDRKTFTGFGHCTINTDSWALLFSLSRRKSYWKITAILEAKGQWMLEFWNRCISLSGGRWQCEFVYPQVWIVHVAWIPGGNKSWNYQFKIYEKTNSKKTNTVLLQNYKVLIHLYIQVINSWNCHFQYKFANILLKHALLFQFAMSSRQSQNKRKDICWNCSFWTIMWKYGIQVHVVWKKILYLLSYLSVLRMK